MLRLNYYPAPVLSSHTVGNRNLFNSKTIAPFFPLPKGMTGVFERNALGFMFAGLTHEIKTIVFSPQIVKNGRKAAGLIP